MRGGLRPGDVALPLLDASTRRSQRRTRCAFGLSASIFTRDLRADAALHERDRGRDHPRELADRGRRRARAVRRRSRAPAGGRTSRAARRSSSTPRRSPSTRTRRLPDAPARTLVTGALGCLGAWTLAALLDLGEEPVGFDLGADDARLRLVLPETRARRVTLVRGRRHRSARRSGARSTSTTSRTSSTWPRCRCRSAATDPERGARVNVLGTVVVFEAVKARLGRIRRRRLRELDGRLRRRPTPPPHRSRAAPRPRRSTACTRSRTRARRASSGRTTASRRSGSDRTSCTGRAATRVSPRARRSRWRPPHAATATRSATAERRSTTSRPTSAAPSRSRPGRRPRAHTSRTSRACRRRAEVVDAIEAAAASGRRTGHSGTRASSRSRRSLQATSLEHLVGPLPRTPLADGVRATIEHFRARG